MSRSRDTSQVQDNGASAVAPFVAGKNKIINGDFGVWQRGTSFSGAGAYYTADRWTLDTGGSNATFAYSQQTFTPGTAPVSGYEGTYFLRMAQSNAGTGQSYFNVAAQRIEDVRVFAGQTVTVSAWIKADAARTVAFQYAQLFGTGGSSAIIGTGTTITLSTSWVRYTQTFTIPSISTKTVGTGSSLQIALTAVGLNTAQTIDIWGVQLEAGSVATPFTTATGTVQGELAACQRYYCRYGSSAAYSPFGTGMFILATQLSFTLPYKVRMRTTPAISFSAASTFATYSSGGPVTAGTGIALDRTGDDMAMLTLTIGSSLTAGQAGNAITNGASAAYIEASAEL